MKYFQTDVRIWLIDCFGHKIANDPKERNLRFIEESIELVQATGLAKSEVIKLVDYVYNRPEGNIAQEVGGVMVTLGALCEVAQVKMFEEGEKELIRVMRKTSEIREKHQNKPADIKSA